MKKKFSFLVGLLLLSNLYAQTKLPNSISRTEKIYGLSKFWNEVNFNFAYLNKIDKQKWDFDYKKLIEEVQNTKNDYEYYLLLQKFAASLKDGHTSIEFPSTISTFLINAEFGATKFVLKNIEGKAIITQINQSKRKKLPLGTEIIEVNGIPTNQYLNQFIKPYISSNTENLLDALAVSFLFHKPKGTTFNVRFKTPKGKTFFQKLTLMPATEKAMHKRSNDEGVFSFKWLKNQTAYVSLNSFGDGKIYSLFLEKLPEIKKAKQLIIDLRKNLGGNSTYAHAILKHLTYDNEINTAKSLILDYNPLFEHYGEYYSIKAKDTLQGSAENRKMLSRAYLTAKDSYFYKIPFHTIENSIPKQDRIVIPTAILTSNLTASSAEDFLVATDNQKHMIRVGEASAGTTGMPMSFILPGNGSAKICIKKEIYSDGREFVGYGIQPNIKVKTTHKDYIENKDSVLLEAIKHLNENKL
ncbi:TSPc domain-containing protein [Tenacibaculum sp. 190524A02b]|uniref:TSPc domain-containing protein n=1 Tax=Tenacibaculum vairaonense TaxID=3137860 RepID=A0ABP1F9H1_9FLAO